MKENIELVISPRENDLGDGFIVKRALPFSKKRMVGPFIFLDHMGPVTFKEGYELKVRAHPHIGLSTLTYLFSGEIIHRDTLGYEQVIRPNEVNWMTAGKGIAHSERSNPESFKIMLEGIQVWIALPKALEDINPSFVHVEAKDVPEIHTGASTYKLVAGEAFGKKSPVPVQSPLFYLSGEIVSGEVFHMKLAPEVEGAVYIARGKLKVGDQSYEAGSLICFRKGSAIDFESINPSCVVIIGGEVFPEKRFIFWNFVSTSEEKIAEAKKNWTEGRFGKVFHEEEYIPLPENK